MKGGLHIDSSVRNRVAEKSVEPIPKIQKTVFSVLDIVFISRSKTNKLQIVVYFSKTRKRPPFCFVTSPDCEVHASTCYRVISS